MRRKRQRNMGWNTTNIIGAITLTMQQLGFNNSDIDLTIFGTLRIRQRFTPETINRVGILLDGPDASERVLSGNVG